MLAALLLAALALTGLGRAEEAPAPVLPFVAWDEYFFDPAQMDLGTGGALGATLPMSAILADSELRGDPAGGAVELRRDIAGGTATEIFRFAVQGARWSLVEVRRERDSGDVASVVFDPPLPDLRAGPPSEDFRASWRYLGEARGSQPRGEITIGPDLRPDTARVVLVTHRPRAPRKPPAVAHLAWRDGEIWIRSAVLGRGQSVVRAELDAPPPVSSLDVLAGVDFVWEVRPHRVSWAGVRMPGTLSEEDPGWFRFEGGTWASGEVASDRVHHVLRSRHLGGGRYYRLSSEPFELLQPLDSRPRARFTRGTAEWRVRFPPGELPEDPDRVAVFINGFSLQSGYWHADTGATVVGFGVDASVRREGDDLLVRANMLKGIDSVPERIQHLTRYADFGAIDVVIALLDQPARHTVRYSDGRRPVRLGAEAPRPLSCGEETRVDPDFVEEPVALTGVQFWLDHRVQRGRYLRRLSTYADESVFNDQVDNAGTVSWAMRLRAGKGTLRLADGAAQGYACAEGWGRQATLSPTTPAGPELRRAAEGEALWVDRHADGLRAGGAPLPVLLALATGVPLERIELGRPLDGRWDVSLQGADPAAALFAAIERELGLKVRLERRATAALVLSGGEPARYVAPREARCTTRWRGRSLRLSGCDATEIARTLDPILPELVLDESGLDRPLDVTIRFRLADIPGSAEASLRRQGLELSRRQEEVEWIVVE